MSAPMSLGAVDVLRQLPEAALTRLTASSREMQVRKGAVVFRRGAPASLYAVQRGRIAILGEIADGESVAELVLSIIRPGQLFGEASLFCGVHQHEARALEPAVIREIDAHACRAALEAHPRAAFALTALMAERRGLAEARLCELAFQSVRGRLLRQLQRLAVDAGIVDSRGRIIADRLTHEELARLIGASRVAVSRALTALRRSGHIAVSGRRFIVPPAARAHAGGTTADSLVA